MSDRQMHRTTLLIALFGVVLMIAAAASQLGPEPSLPSSESSRPSAPDWARPVWEPRA